MSIISAHPDYTPNDTDFEFATEIYKADINGDVGIRLLKGTDDSAYLWWTDYVANDWCEHYTTVAHAFARLAMLHACADSDWNKGFTSQPKDFANNLDIFIDSQVR